jgi:hypothetical protein
MECLGLIIALLGSAFTIVGAMIAMMLWVRSEANADRRGMQNTVDAIRDEMKDFHARLLVIEERRNKFIFKE